MNKKKSILHSFLSTPKFNNIELGGEMILQITYKCNFRLVKNETPPAMALDSSNIIIADQ